MLPLVYHEGYVIPLPEGHRFPMPKFGLLRDHLVETGLATTGNLHKPDSMIPLDWLKRVHTPDYIDTFCGPGLHGSAERKAGLPWTEALVTRSRLAVAGTLLTARLAMRHGLACHLAGGTHHAHPDHASGFCLLNDLAVTAQSLLDQHEADQILILDLDVHQGDGTAVIFRDEPRVFTFSMHGEKNFPLKKAASDLDVGLPDGMADEAYLTRLRDGDGRGFAGLSELIEQVEPDVVLYDAGADVHIEDRLGRMALSDQGVAARDRLVLETCMALGVPVGCVIGGGYDRDHARLARRHAILHRTAALVWAASAGTRYNVGHA